MNVLLIGPRGSGKSTIGRRLAARRGDRFIDTDRLALATFREPTVSEVWARHGEAAWRRAELGVLRSCLAADGAVAALGGGIPMIAGAAAEISRARRQGRARVIYLHCEPATLRQRLAAHPGDRPPLRGEDALGEIEQVLAEREPVYRSLSDWVVDVTNRTEPEALEAVQSALAGSVRPA